MVSKTGPKHSLASGAAKREEIVGVVLRFWREEGRSPSYAEIARDVGLSSRNTVKDHVRRLVSEGRLAYDDGGTGNYRLQQLKVVDPGSVADAWRVRTAVAS